LEKSLKKRVRSEPRMRNRVWIAGLILAIILFNLSNVTAVSAQLPRKPFQRPPFDVDPEDLPKIRTLLATYFIGKTITSIVNSVLLLYLLLVYYGIYRNTKSSFSLGLMVMSVALMTFTISSSPLFHWALSRRLLFGVFNFIPDLFTTVAAVILIYLSRQ